MTLDRLRPLADRALGPFVAASTRLGLSPDAVSAIAALAAAAAGGTFALAATNRLWYLAGAVLVAVSGWLDLVDGALARELGTDSAAGDLLDHVLDRYADIVLVSGFAASVGSFALGLAAVTGVLMTSYLGTQAEAVGLDRVYGGLVGRADRIVLLAAGAVVAALLPGRFVGLPVAGWVLVVLAVSGHGTAVQRFYHSWGRLRE